MSPRTGTANSAAVTAKPTWRERRTSASSSGASEPAKRWISRTWPIDNRPLASIFSRITSRAATPRPRASPV